MLENQRKYDAKYPRIAHDRPVPSVAAIPILPSPATGRAAGRGESKLLCCPCA